VWKYGRHPIRDGWELEKARKKDSRNPAQDENIMSASATQGGHKNAAAKLWPS